MARFDLYEDRTHTASYLVDIQSEFHDHLSSHVTIPLLKPHLITEPVKGLHLPFTLEDEDYIIAVNLIATLPRHYFGKKVTNLSHYRDDITQALDFLMQGF